MGGDTRKENIDLLSPEQSGFLSNTLGSNGAYSEFLQPYNQEGFQDLFQKSFIDPAQKNLQQQVIPGIKESFLGLDESGSGSLNRALAQSATDVSTGLGQQYMNFFNQQQQNKLGAMGQMGGLAGINTFQPHIEQQQGILGPIIAALGQVGGGLTSGGLGPLLKMLMGSGANKGSTDGIINV